MRRYLYLLFGLLFLSCSYTPKLPDGEHRAFIAQYNTVTNESSDYGAHVVVRNGVVKIIYIPGLDSITNFDFWETKRTDRQDAYTDDGQLFGVYLIQEDY